MRKKGKKTKRRIKVKKSRRKLKKTKIYF
jgi:hypothetical protein